MSPFRRVVRALKNRGATVLPVSLPNTCYALSAYYVIASAEASSNLARYDGVQYGLHIPLPPDSVARSPGELYAHSRTAGFGAEVKRRILLGTYALTAEYAHFKFPLGYLILNISPVRSTTTFCKLSACVNVFVTILCVSSACPTRSRDRRLRMRLVSISFCTRPLFAQLRIWTSKMA